MSKCINVLLLDCVVLLLLLFFHIYYYFNTPGRGLPYGSGLGLSRCLGPGECLHSFIHYYFNHCTNMPADAR